MKRSLVAAAAGCLAAAAHAQSNTTFYGSLDQGLAYINNLRGGKAVRLDPGTMQPDRFGLRGTEDIGGGLKANFLLEAGFFTDTGGFVVPGKLFNRNAWVGLSSRFGSVQLGHQPDFVFDYVGPTSNGFLLTNFYLFHPGNFDNLANQFQADNAVKLQSPVFGGLQLGAMYGFGEVPGSAGTNRTYSLGANYTRGGLRAALAYTDSNNRPLDIAGRTGITQTLGTALVPGTAVAMDSVRTAAAGASYRMDSLPLAFNALYSQTRIKQAGNEATSRNVDLGLTWRPWSANAVNLGYTFSKFESARWNQLGLSNVYYFSRRTQAYVQLTYQRAGGGAPFAAINGVGVSGGRNQAVTSIGVHHSF